MHVTADLRSDTVTRPTPAMRKAMAEAEVGDDGWGDDPTVRRLEAVFAERLGKEAAVFVPSGTMANQIALRLLGTPGTNVVVGRTAHVVTYENGGAGMNSACQLHTVDDANGVLDIDAVRLAVEAASYHWLPASAVFVENTHMPSCGTPWPLEALAAVADVGLPMHMDGARLFNAAVATGVEPAAYAARAVTVMCCLSKGLGAPIGSLIALPAELEARARGERQRLGGGMRQVGILAAAGLVALADHVDRLADDHARARALAGAVAARWPGSIDPGAVRTNIVIWRHPERAKVLDHLTSQGVLAGDLGPDVLRAVTHLDVDDDGLDRAVEAISTCPI